MTPSSPFIFQGKWKHDCKVLAILDKMKYVTASFWMYSPPTLQVEGIRGPTVFINWTSCLLHLHGRSPNLPLDLAFQTSSFSHNALHLAVTPTEGAGRERLAWRMWYRGAVCRPLSPDAPVLLQQYAGAWGVSRDDLFSVLLVNLQRDSGCSRGHLSARSGLQAISTAMKSTTELYMKAQLRTASITPTWPLQLGDI